MSLLLPNDGWPSRRAAASGPLAPLADSLTAELEPLLASDPYIPREKAVLSRSGGRCAVDGTLLDFDPFQRHDHRCPACGRTYQGELHDRFWLYWYQLWLAERAVHAALLYQLRGDARHAALARAILAGYAEQYLAYPNRDNVLGPTRVFFSTYIESIWLLQLCVALDLLEAGGDETIGALVRDRVVEPSASLIALYNEGISNRQAWNNAALMAANVVLEQPAAVEPLLTGSGGLLSHLSRALLRDGTWYEGENYHLFAHRGLWYCVTIAETLGAPLPGDLVARFQEGFATPLLTALPDHTLVSRRDSQYAISLRQIRFAEMCELGLARAADERLNAMLHTLYAADIARRDTGRWRSTADVERNLPPTRLTRGDLGWRSLLRAVPELPPSQRANGGSVILDAQGIAVLRRRGGSVYAALDYGHSGGGHGHPDRLNLLLADHRTRWLDDMGTGSYVDRSLFWYRSTLAHNAPLVDGQSQARVNGRLLAYDERGAAGWVDASARDIAPGVEVRRAIVVMPDYLVDEVTWTADRDVTLDLPFHVDGALRGIDAWLDAPLVGGRAAEDGFEFLRDSQRAHPTDRRTACLDAESTDRRLVAWFAGDSDVEWWRAVAPGPPGMGARRFHVARLHGRGGSLRSVWSWAGAVSSAAVSGETIEIALSDGTRHLHARRNRDWHVDFVAGGARSSIDLAGWREEEPQPAATIGLYGDATTSAPATPAPPLPLPRAFVLGEEHYRRTEQSWTEAGRPTATIELSIEGVELHVAADVAKWGDPIFAAADAINRYDNEPPDINSDGLQLYVRIGDARGAWVIVPDANGASVRARVIPTWEDLPLPHATWRRTGRGYAVDLAIELPDLQRRAAHSVDLDVIVNEISAERERRCGQLVLSGAAGEFAYLAGDRHDPDRLLRFRIEP